MGKTFSFGDGKTLWERARNRKDFVVIEGAGHYEIHDKPEYVGQAIDRLPSFYDEYLQG